MKGVMSALGLGPLALIIGATLFLGQMASCTSSVYQAPMSSQDGTGAAKIAQAALFAESYMEPQHIGTFVEGSMSRYNSNSTANSNIAGFSSQKLISLFQLFHVPGDSVQVECVGFVETVFALANSSSNPKSILPAAAYSVGAAEDFWPTFASQSGWQEIPNGQAPPLPGDIVVWKGGKAGHVAIVVAVNQPINGQAGSVVVAQGNLQGNFITPNTLAPGVSAGIARAPGVPAGIELFALPFSNNTVSTDSPLSEFTLLGYIRDTAAQTYNFSTSLPAAASVADCVATTPQTPANANTAWWEQIAKSDATKYGIDPTVFANQIRQESGFNPKARSGAGAIGIAQFIPSTAASQGVDPSNPVSALCGSAKMMAHSYQSYLGSSSSPQDAYAKALADYNCGCVQSTYRRYGSAWIDHLPTETSNYIKVIMGI